MITAKNYASQAYQDLITASKKASLKSDRNQFALVAQKLFSAVHFVMPDGGMIFNDNKKGIINEYLNLPFKLMSLEYFVSTTIYFNPVTNKIDHSLVHSPKRVILLEQNDMDSNLINLYSMCYATEFKRFVLYCASLTINKNWYLGGSKVNAQNHRLLSCYDFVQKEDMLVDFASDIGSSLEFLEAVSCSNVDKELYNKSDIARNNRRIKKNKKPIFEAYRLTVRVPGSANKSESIIGSGRQGPREHLRRGHIRRINDGRKIWVNSCVVGNRSNGIIQKDYNIVAA